MSSRKTSPKKVSPKRMSDSEYRLAFTPVTTDALEAIEKSIVHVDTAATKLQKLLGKVTSGLGYMQRKRGNAEECHGSFEDCYTGTSEMAVDVGSESKPLTSPNAWRPDRRDVATQVRSKDIKKAYADIIAQAEKARKQAEWEEEEAELLALEKAGEEEDEEEQQIEVVKKESLRADAFILTRPAGYKPLELSWDMDAVTANMQTQVTDHMIDVEYALLRGIFLGEDDILWPCVGEFNLDMATKRIQDYVEQCWTLDPKWMYTIKPIQTFSDDNRKRFIFEVKFSVPTPLSPIPHATASIFFIFEISHYARGDDLVKVHYVIEGTRFMHTPGSLPFQDKWLWAIISDKVRIQRMVNF